MLHIDSNYRRFSALTRLKYALCGQILTKAILGFGLGAEIADIIDAMKALFSYDTIPQES